MIIPKYHSERLDEVPDQYLADILPLAKKIALSTGHANYNLLQVGTALAVPIIPELALKQLIAQNNGKKAFQHVPHVHLHLIPKPNLEDGMIFREEDFARKVERSKDELAKARRSSHGLPHFGNCLPSIQTLEKMKEALS